MPDITHMDMVFAALMGKNCLLCEHIFGIKIVHSPGLVQTNHGFGKEAS